MSDRNDRRSFLSRSVLNSGQVKPVPMDNIRVSGVIDHVDRDRTPLAKPQDRAWNLAVVARGLDRFPWGEFERDRGDAQRVVRLFRGRLFGGMHEMRYRARDRQSYGVFEQRATINGHDFSLRRRCPPLSYAQAAHPTTMRPQPSINR